MSYYSFNSQDGSGDEFIDKDYDDPSQDANSTRNSSSVSNTESDFNEDSSSESNDSTDDEFDLKPTRKQARKPKTTAANQSGQRSSSKKSQKDLYTSEVKKSKKYWDESDSDSSMDFEQYSDSFEESGIANRERSRRNTTSMNYNESDDEDDQDDFTEDEEPIQEPKEEYTGPIIERIIGTEIEKKGEKRKYYCKFKNESYVHCQWLTSAEIDQVHNGTNALKKWKREKKKFSGLMEGAEESVNNLQVLPNYHDNDIINPEYFEVFRVIAYDSKTDQYLVQWSASIQPDDEFTWESKEYIDNEAALTAFEKREEKYYIVKNQIVPDHRIIQRPERYYEYSEANHNIPHFKDGLELRDYQLVGLNWLRKCWYNHKSSILADEMGLGKTVQGVCMVNELFKLGFRGPYLAIAPKSTLMQWEREFHAWTDLNVIRYSEGKKARDMIREYELYWKLPDGTNDESFEKFEVMLLNYEKLLKEDVQGIVNKFTWEYVVVDEAHRLKNSNNKTYQIIENLLNSRKIKHILLMTGTPMQNHQSEIWGLLHLIDPHTFDNLEEFEREFDNNQNTEKLQQIIEPYMLRRVKNDVEKTIGSKEENIVEVELSNSQKILYRQTLEKNAAQASNSNYATNNVKMQLRKVCNHPYLLKEPKRSIDSLIDDSEKCDNELTQLIQCCGKMLFVDMLLTSLRQNPSNKVLIFSQMTQILEIFQDYCVLKNYKYERIDGQVKGNKRQQAMDRFNDPKTNTFIFLLCTKAGGQGLNLTAANYVIIYDSDWNPQNDIQAQARCHRIGQKNKVEVFRLVSRGTYETKMLKDSLDKMKLDQAIDKTTDETRYIIRFDLKSYSSVPLGELMSNKITIRNQEELEQNLASEACEGDLDDRNFMQRLKELNERNELAESRTRTRRRIIYSSEDEFSEDEDEFPPDFKVQKMKMALLSFGWGKWQKIQMIAFQDPKPEKDVIYFSSIVLYTMIYPIKDKIDNPTTFQELTGLEGIDQIQQKLVRKLLRDSKLQKEFTNHKEKYERRLFELKLFNDRFDNPQAQMPIVDLPQTNVSWSPTNDWDIISAIQEHGWDNWKAISEDIKNKNEMENSLEDVKKFLRKRFHDIFAKIIHESKEFSQRFNIQIKSGDKEKHHHGDGSHSRREHRNRDNKKEIQKKQQEEDPRVIKLKLLSKALCLFGQPMNEEQWASYEHYCNCDDDTHRDEVPRIIEAAHKLLGSKVRDPDYVFDESDQRIFRHVMTEKLADEIAISCQWFQKFREFYPVEFEENESKLSSLDPHPEWWKHSEFDPILFNHIDHYGFSRPFSLIAQQPFASMIPKAIDEISILAQKEEKNDHGRFEHPNVEPLDILIKKHKLMSHIDLIINDLRNEKLPLITLKLNSKDLAKPEIPYMVDNCLLESYGDGDFRAIDGYLYRQGYSARVKYHGQYYKCTINSNSYMPFQVTPTSTNREYSGKSPHEAWCQALGTDPDTESYHLFGIGIPIIRYRLQQKLENKRVSGYRPIIFEIVKPPEERSIPQFTVNSSSSFSFLGNKQSKKKKLFPM